MPDNGVATATSASNRAVEIDRARAIREGAAVELDDVIDLAKSLTRDHLYSHCRQMLAKVLKKTDQLDGDHRAALVQYYALSCSEDPGLRSQQEIGRSLKLLNDAVDLAKTTDSKSLAIAGALHKR